MTKTKLTATDSYGETFTRTTARDYAFVVVARMTQAIADRSAAGLAELLAEREAAGGDEAVAKATDARNALKVQIQAAQDAEDWEKARDLSLQGRPASRLATIDSVIEYARKRHAEVQQQADDRAVNYATWTSRHDLALKAAAKAEAFGTVEIVPVG